jgi:hypothetical protein
MPPSTDSQPSLAAVHSQLMTVGIICALKRTAARYVASPAVYMRTPDRIHDIVLCLLTNQTGHHIRWPILPRQEVARLIQ